MIKEHIDELVKDYNLSLVKDGNFFYDTETRVAHIACEVVTKNDYWHSLHELGHAILGHTTPNDWDSEARMEIEAWNFVIEHSVIKISPAVKAKWNRERIQGSWERK